MAALPVGVGAAAGAVLTRPSLLQMLRLLQFLIIENQQKLKEAISRLEPFPDLPAFTELRAVQNQLKFRAGAVTLTQVTLRNRANGCSSLMTPRVGLLQEVVHFLSVASCGSLLLTRLEGLKQLSRQLRGNKGQMRELLGDAGPCPSVPAAEHANSVLVKLVLDLLQLCKLAARHPGGAHILGTRGKTRRSSGLLRANAAPFEQRRWAAVWENWALWTSPPSPCCRAETPSTRRPRRSSPTPSCGSSISCSAA